MDAKGVGLSVLHCDLGSLDVLGEFSFNFGWGLVNRLVHVHGCVCLLRCKIDILVHAFLARRSTLYIVAWPLKDASIVIVHDEEANFSLVVLFNVTPFYSFEFCIQGVQPHWRSRNVAANVFAIGEPPEFAPIAPLNAHVHCELLGRVNGTTVVNVLAPRRCVHDFANLPGADHTTVLGERRGFVGIKRERALCNITLVHRPLCLSRVLGTPPLVAHFGVNRPLECRMVGKAYKLEGVKRLVFFILQVLVVCRLSVEMITVC